MPNIPNPIIIYHDVSKSISDNTKQIAEAFKTFKGGLQIAIPVFPKSVLINACKNSTVNSGCIAIKAATVAGVGYEFADPDNADATGVTSFCDNLIDRNGCPISLSRLLANWYSDYGMFADSHLEIARQGGIPTNLLLLSGKNTYTDLDRTFIAQIISSGEKINRATIFRPYGEYTSTERDVLSLVRQTPFDDVYGVPVYISGLTAIEANNKITIVNNNAMDNTINGSQAVVIIGDVDKTKYDAIENTIRTLKARKGATGIIHLPGGATINFQTIGSTSFDGNYIQEREDTKLEILGLHNIPADLYSAIQKGGISSGDRATGALKIFLQTFVRPEQEMLSKMFDNFLMKEFAGYQGGFKLKEIDLTDWLEDQQAAQLQAQIQQTYINTGSLKMLNEYRTSINLDELTQQEFDTIRGGNIDFNVAAPAGF